MKFTPNLFTFQNGTYVNNINEWELRRKEILGILQSEVYGVSPNPPQKVEGEILSVEEKMCSGHAVWKTIKLSFETDTGIFSFPFNFVMPNDGKVHPLFVMLNFRPGVYDSYCSPEEVIDNGFALAIINYSDVTTDDGDMTNGLIGKYSQEKYSWGKIGAWAFAASRVIDYLIEFDGIDKENIAVGGHSRLGKTALWCGAQDERIKYVISNDSGCGGAALEQTKHEGAETIAIMTSVFPYWFTKNYLKYADDSVIKPFDQHFLLSLVAPRYVLIGSASKDLWADPYSEQLSCVASSEVWKLYGKKGFVGRLRPAKIGESFSNGDIHYHLRDGIHFFGRPDWNLYMNFINSKINKKV